MPDNHVSSNNQFYINNKNTYCHPQYQARLLRLDMYLRIFSVVLALTLFSCGSNEDAAESAQEVDIVHKCDEFAAHPDDPNKWAVGVDEDSLIASPAIKFCAEAIEEYPNSPRFQFQLGRSLLKAEQYKKGAQHLEKAAKMNYGPAYAYLADVYRYGVLGEPNLEKAESYYDIAIESGFSVAEDAKQGMLGGDTEESVHQEQRSTARPSNPAEMIDRALGEDQPLRDATTFDPSPFSSKEILSWLYDGDFESLNDRQEFTDTLYMAHLNNYFSEPVNFHSSSCAGYADPELSRRIMNRGMDAVGIDNNFNFKQGGLENLMRSIADMARNGPGQVMQRAQTFDVIIGSAKRDGVRLSQLYGCSSQVFQRIYSNMANYLRGQEPVAAGGWAALKLGCYKHAMKKGGDHATSKTTCQCISNRFQEAGVSREQAERFGENYDHGRNFSQLVSKYNGLKQRIATCLL